MPELLLNDFNLGGLSDSKYQGPKNSVNSLVGWDLHSEPGILKVAQKMIKESGSTIDGFVKTIVACSDGNTYLFSSTSGKIWKRDANAAYSLVATVAVGAGVNSILDAKEHEGYVYYSTETVLGRWQIGTDWSTRADSWNAFLKDQRGYKPMRVKNGILYIGDKNVIAQVEAGVFSDNALDFEDRFIIQSLGETEFDLLAGCGVSITTSISQLFRWDTYSESFSSSDPVPESGINSFVNSDNSVLLQAGVKGAIYAYNNLQNVPYKRIPGDWTGTNKAIIYPNASENVTERLYLGVSNVSGNPCLQGVYGLAAYSAGYPQVLSLDYPLSPGQTSNLEIGAVKSIGDNILVSWRTQQPTPMTYESYSTGGDSLLVQDTLNKWNSQSFTPQTTHYIEGVRIKGQRTGNPGDFIVELRLSDGSDQPTGAVLATGTYQAGYFSTDVPTDASAFTSIYFTTPYQVASGTKYCLQFRSLATVDGGNNIQIFFDDTAASYPRGKVARSVDGGSTWTVDSGRDIIFEEFGSLSQNIVTYGVDTIDFSNRYSGAYLDSRILVFNRKEEKSFEVKIFYRILPVGTTINLWKSVNYGAFELVESFVDDPRKLIDAGVNVPDAAAVQFRVTTTASGNSAPEIEGIYIKWN